MKDKHLTIALAGNPNSGKTTIFNAITGARQHVGNYPGVTVEKKTGDATHNGVRLEVVDLPGTYSLTAYSIEEVVARNVLLDEKLDVVVAIVDSSNLERNLYLATQLMELSVPLVLAFNMSDLAESRGYSIDDNKLSELLGVPIVKTVGNKGRGIAELLDTALAVARNDQAVASQRHPNYGGEIEPHMRQLTDLVAEKCDNHRPRWFAVKLLENDAETIKRLRQMCPEHVEELLSEAGRLRRHIGKICGDAAEIILADRRYGFISGACTESVTHSGEVRPEGSDRIDTVITNRYLGLPIFAILMFLVFQLTFAVGNPLVDLLDGWKGDLAAFVAGLWDQSHADSLLRSLLVDGIIEGVGAVMVFTPLIMLLFLAIAVLEDSGYMARAAFV
ncbi:MAG: ferrous iron transport protein B, partial [Phycisphaerae bacterium]|nr:ferrous iron transport protein B [Phycisphaerae bacterium]